MRVVTIRNLLGEVHRALKLRAAQHNRSTKAEIRALLEAAVRSEGRLRLGTALADRSRALGLRNRDVEALEGGRAGGAGAVRMARLLVGGFLTRKDCSRTPYNTSQETADAVFSAHYHF